MKKSFGCVAENIRLLMYRYGLSAEEVAKTMCVSKTTFYGRMREPRTFSLGELKVLAALFHVQVEQMIQEKI